MARLSAKALLRAFLTVLVAALVAVLAGLVPISLGPFVGSIANSVREATGLELAVDGPITAKLGPNAGVRAGSVALATPDGAALLVVDDAQVKVSLLALLRGSVRVRELTITGTKVDPCLELPDIDAEPQGGVPPDVVVDAFRVAEGVIACDGEPTDFRIDLIEGAAPANAPVTIGSTVTLASNELTIAANGGTLAEILSGSSFPFGATLATSDAEVSADGDITRSGDTVTADAHLTLHFANTAELANAFSISLPDLGAIGVEGRVRGEPGSFEIIDASGFAGQTRFVIAGTADFRAPRPFFDLTASSPMLDLAPFIDDEPAPTSAPWDLSTAFDALATFDAKWSATAGKVTGISTTVERVLIDGSLTDGSVEIASASADLLGGRAELEGSLDSRAECPEVAIDAGFEHLDVVSLQNAGWLNAPLTGALANVNATVSACGTRATDYLESLSVTATAADGQLVLEDGTPVDINALEVAVEPVKRIRASVSSSIAGETIAAELTAGTLQAMLSDAAWPIRITAKGAGSELGLEGTARLSADGFSFDVTSEINAPDVGTLSTWIDVAPDAGIPLLAEKRLRLDASRFVAEQVNIALGQSDLTGSLTWHHAQSPDTLVLSLRSNFLDLDEIDKLLPRAAGPDATEEAADEPPLSNPSLPPVDLDLAVAEFRGGKLDLQELVIGGRLRAGLIDDANVSVLVEDELLLKGDLDVDIRRLPAALAFKADADNVDLGRLLRRLGLVDDLVMRADGMRLEVDAAGTNAREVLTSTSIDADVLGFAWDLNQPASDSMLELRFESLDISMLRGQSLSASTRGEIDGTPLELLLQTPSVDTLLERTAELPVRVVAGLDDQVAMFDLTIDRTVEEQLHARLELSGQALDRDDRDLATLESPLADYGITGDLLLDESGLFLSDLEIYLGQSVLRGSGSLSNPGRQRLEIDLAAETLQSNDLSYLPVFRDSAEAGPQSTDEETENAGQQNRGPLVVLHEFIARYQENADLEFSFNVEELLVGDDVLGGAELRLHIDENDFRLEPLTIRLPGGGLDAAYTWEAQGGRVDASLKAHVDGLAYGGLVRLAEPASPANGLLYLDVVFNAETDWTTEVSEFELLLRNANGHVELAAWPGNMEADILDLWTTNLIFALVPAPEDGERSRLNCVVARFEAEDGLLKAKTAMLDSTNTVVRGRGKIDLAQGEIDLLITPQAKREKFFSASTPVKVTGPLSDFEIGVEPGGFLGTLLKWYTSLIYVPYKWITGQRFPEDGTQTCFDALDWELTPELEAYFQERDFTRPPLIN